MSTTMPKHSMTPLPFVKAARRPLAAAQQGYIMLISVIIVAAVALAVAVAVVLLGVGATRNSQTVQQSNQALAMANYCAETAIINLQNKLSYGNGTLVVDTLTDPDDNATCTIAVLGNGNQNRTIQVSGTAGSYRRNIQVGILRVRPQIQISSWQEVADF